MPDGGELVHATCVACDLGGLLLRGPPGSGKSDLALRLIANGPRGFPPFRLVADDQVLLRAVAGRLEASAPATIAGLIEVRGVGIVSVPHAASARVDLVVDLVRADEVPRLPDPPPATTILEITLPILRLVPFEASAHIKAALALAMARGSAGLL